MNFDSIFKPQSIALVGASRDENSVGFSLYKNLVASQYSGSVYAVNPKADSLLGKPVYHTVGELPSSPELAIVAIPAQYVESSLKDLVALGVRAVIVISAGYKESGDEGKKRESELVEFCKLHQVTLIGPNCLGILNPHLGLNASFETVLPEKGSIGFISQSGALISSLLDIANYRGIGFSKVVSVGNKAMASEAELLPYLFKDIDTKVILLYSEALQDASGFIQLIQKNAHSNNPKPVIVLKAGITAAGQKASSSHTGSLAGSDVAYDALMKQAGVIRVRTINELLSTAHVFATSSLPKNRNIAIITNAGGPGIIATDEADRCGLILSSFSHETETTLRQILPQAAHVSNPVDLLGDAKSDRYEQALQAVGADPQVESIVAIVTPQSMTDIAETAHAVVNARNETKKLISASFIGEPLVDPGVGILTQNDVPHTQFPEDAVRAVAHACYFYETTQKPYYLPQTAQVVSTKVATIIQDLKHNNVSLVNTETVFTLLSLCNLPVVKSTVVQSAEDAERAIHDMATSVAIKIISPDISHKTDVGGVLLHVEEHAAQEQFRRLLENVKTNAPQAKTHGVMISEMIENDGIEMIIGAKREPGLGTLIMVGLGGVYVEILRDAVFRFAPLTEHDAKEMIESLRSKALLYGYRGGKKRDISVIMRSLLAVSQLMINVPEIEELDINPLLVHEENAGGVILDARIVLSK